MYSPVILLLIFATCGGQKESSAIISNSINTVQADTSRYTIIPYKKKDTWLFKDSKPATLSTKDIGEIESLLAEAVLEHNKMVKGVMVISPLEEYKLQLIPATNEKGEKIIYVNCFCSSNSSFAKNWRTELVVVFDGGACFFNIKINLSTKKTYDLMVNGVG